MSLFAELKRRNVLRVAIAYTAAAWMLIQVADIIFPRLGLSDTAVTNTILVLAIGFIPAVQGICRPNLNCSALNCRNALEK